MTRRLPVVGLACTAAVAASTARLRRLSPEERAAVLRASSTNVDNLRAGHLSVLVRSLPVMEDDPGPAGLLVLLVVLGAVEVVHGSGGLLTVLVVGHAGVSLVVATGLAAALAAGRVPRERSGEVDVGTSYAVLASVGSLAPPPVLAGVALLLARPLLRSWQPATSDVGHLLALLAGGALRQGLERRPRRP